MIVDSMTYDEVLKELKADLPMVNYRIEAENKRFKKLLCDTRSRERYYYRPVTFKSARGFNWVLQFFNEGLGVPSKQRLGLIEYAWFVQNRGLYAITISRLSRNGIVTNHFTFYTPHFIDRYRERFLNDPSIKKVDAFHHFIVSNPKFSSQKLKNPSEKHPNDYWSICNDGLCLCNTLQGFTVEAKTFITWDMVGKDQRQFAIEGNRFMANQGLELDVSFPDEDFDEYSKEE